MMTEWANNDCLNHIGYATKSRVVCMECGERFSTELVNRKRAVCPHCGASLKIEWSRKRTNQQFIRIGKADICEEFQVIRCFELYAYYREGREPHYFIREVLQHWIKDDGKREVMALARNTGCSGWCGNLEIRNKTVGSYYYIEDNDVCSSRTNRIVLSLKTLNRLLHLVFKLLYHNICPPALYSCSVTVGFRRRPEAGSEIYRSSHHG